MSSENTLIEYLQAEIISIIDSIIVQTFGTQLELSEIYSNIERLIKYINVAYKDELITKDDFEYFDNYFSFIYYSLRFFNSITVRAPSGALTLKKNISAENK